MVALTYNHHSNVDMSPCTSQHFHVYMVLTRQTAEIQDLLVNTGAFPFVIVQVQQWGAWKHAPM